MHSISYSLWIAMPLAIWMNGLTIFLRAFSWLNSFVILTLLICRFNRNRKNRRRSSKTSIFDDNISLLLIGNTYIIVLMMDTTWLIMTFNTWAGDMNLKEVLLYHADSFLCRGLVAHLFALTSALYDSFLLQAVWCYLKIVFHSRLSSMKICRLPMKHLLTYLIFTAVSWIVSVVIVIPAYTHFHLFVYLPDLFHCMIPFRNVAGFIYALSTTYIIPTSIIVSLYLELSLIHIWRCRRRG